MTKINQNNKIIEAEGINSQISTNLEITVPQGMTYTVNSEEAANGYVYITVKNQAEESVEYTLYYHQDYTYVKPIKVEDEGNEIKSLTCYDDDIYIEGIQPSLSENAKFTMQDGVEARLVKENEEWYLDVTITGTDYSKRFYIYYSADYSAVEIEEVTDENNQFSEVSIWSKYIELEGRNKELGETVQFKVPEGTVVSKPVRMDGTGNYTVTVTSGMQTREYEIYYLQSAEFFKITGVTDENNTLKVEIDGQYSTDENGYYYGKISLKGLNDTIGSTLNLQMMEGLTSEITYVDPGENGYNAVVTVMNAGASYTYYVYYEQDYTPVEITAVTDENNQFQEDIYIYDNEIYLYGRNATLGETVQFTVPEGAVVSFVESNDEEGYYKIKVVNGILEKEYDIYYRQDSGFFEITDIKDENNVLEMWTNDGYEENGIAYSVINLTGTNESLGETLEITVPEGLSAEINYQVPEGSNYQAVITVTNQGATYNYRVYYEQQQPIS